MAGARQLCTSLLVLPEMGQQARKFSEFLSQSSVEDAVFMLQDLIGLTLLGDPDARLIVQPLFLHTALWEALPSVRRDELAQFALASGRPLVRMLLVDLAPVAEEPAANTFAVVDVRSVLANQKPKDGSRDPITLGERRSLAKSHNRKVLEKLLFDPDPRVLQNLLDNAQIFERDVLKVAARRPNRVELFRLMATHRRWGVNSRVRSALLFNPYSPPLIALYVLLASTQGDIEQVARDENLHPHLREAAREMLRLIAHGR